MLLCDIYLPRADALDTKGHLHGHWVTTQEQQNYGLDLGRGEWGDAQGISVIDSIKDMTNTSKYYLKRSRLSGVFSNKCSCCCLMAFPNSWLQVSISKERGGRTDAKCRVLGGLVLT